MRRLAFFILAGILLTGAVQQEYVQNVEPGGNSIISRKADIGFFGDMLPGGSIDAMENFCSQSSEIECSVDSENFSILISDSFSADSVYYDFISEESLPYITHTLTINRIPTDRFSELTDDIIVGAGIYEESSSPVDPVVLGDAETAGMARSMDYLDIDIRYYVEVPGQITSVECGELQSSISGNQVDFSLVDAMKQQERIVIRSRELNMPYIILICIALAMGALALSFFWEKKKK